MPYSRSCRLWVETGATCSHWHFARTVVPGQEIALRKARSARKKLLELSD